MRTFFKVHKNDTLLIVGILLVAMIGFAIFQLTRQDGDMVEVSVNGEVMGRYSLKKDFETVITTGENGEDTNVLIIRGGEALVTAATCPDKICVDHHAISHVGETIVCLPHKVVISVVGSKNE